MSPDEGKRALGGCSNEAESSDDDVAGNGSVAESRYPPFMKLSIYPILSTDE
jgi:hypothetical protein